MSSETESADVRRSRSFEFQGKASRRLAFLKHDFEQRGDPLSGGLASHVGGQQHSGAKGLREDESISGLKPPKSQKVIGNHRFACDRKSDKEFWSGGAMPAHQRNRKRVQRCAEA